VHKRTFGRSLKPVADELCDEIVRKETHETKNRKGNEKKITKRYIGREPFDALKPLKPYQK
jgi:hypothetical protein